MWNLLDSVLQVYGNTIQSEQEQEEVREFHTYVTVQNTGKALKAKDNVVLNVYAENKAEKNEIFRLYFCEVKETLTENKEEWGAYLENISHEVEIQEFQENAQCEVLIKSFNQGSSEGILKEHKVPETKEGASCIL